MALDVFYSVIGFVLAIAVLVVVHELGHYSAARALGVKVLRFSVGFGRPLLRRTAGPDGTEYVLGALPFGGYVKMLDETEGEVKPEERARAFNRQPLWKRAVIVLAGPGFNFIFAILAYAAVYMHGIEGIKPVVGKVVEQSMAAKAGFQAGDEWLRIDGRPVESWDQYRLYIYRRALDRGTLNIEVRTPSGATETRVLDMSQVPAREVDAGLLEKTIGLYGYVPEVKPLIGSVQAGGPAANAGLKVGDRVLSMDGETVQTWQEVVNRIMDRPGKAIAFMVDRAGAQVPLTITPRVVTAKDKTIGKIDAGVEPPRIPREYRVLVQAGPLAALARATENTWSMSILTLKMLYKMLVLEVSTENISGPITIAQYAGYSVQIGLDRFVLFLAIVSISLGVLNLLPIPVLDGGHLLFYVVEAIKGKPLSERALGMGQRVGMAVLFGLMILAFYNDFVRILQ